MKMPTIQFIKSNLRTAVRKEVVLCKGSVRGERRALRRANEETNKLVPKRKDMRPQASKLALRQVYVNEEFKVDKLPFVNFEFREWLHARDGDSCVEVSQRLTSAKRRSLPHARTFSFFASFFLFLEKEKRRRDVHLSLMWHAHDNNSPPQRHPPQGRTPKP
jgi:hypothetical protein